MNQQSWYNKTIEICKPSDMSNVVLLTHKGCLDGCGCALLFLKNGGKKENIKYIAAGTLEKIILEDPLLDSNKFLLFADIGLNHDNEDAINKLEKRGNCIIIDHHKTSASLKKREWCIIDSDNGGTACGTELLRRYLQLEDFDSKRISTIIDDYDRWQLKIPESMQLATFMTWCGQDEFVSLMQNRNFSNGVFTESEKNILRIIELRRDENINKAIHKAIHKTILINNKIVKIAYVISNEANASLLLGTLLNKYQDLDCAAQINFDKGVSLRSRNGYDVSSMAKIFGGGGHAGASAHPFKKDFIKNIIEEVHNG